MVEVPEQLAELVLVRGPRLFRAFVEAAGGVSAASRIMGCTTATVQAWGSPLTPAGLVEATGRRWGGYPTPLPEFDRIAEVLAPGSGAMFQSMQILEASYGEWPDLEVLLELWEEGSRFKLLHLGFSEEKLRRACNDQGIPAMTRFRWIRRGFGYPSSWKALDRLSKSQCGKRWLHAVITEPAPPLDRVQVPPGALAVMVHASSRN